MKATGIVRRIDDLGRVVIPKEIRPVSQLLIHFLQLSPQPFVLPALFQKQLQQLGAAQFSQFSICHSPSHSGICFCPPALLC